MDTLTVLKEKKNWAVIGVTPNHEKFGYKIYQKLKELNKNVYGISPIYQELEGDKLYPTLPKQVDVVVFIVNKKYAPDYISAMKELSISLAWMQPGTYDEDLLKLFKANHITTLLDCVLVQSEKL